MPDLEKQPEAQGPEEQQNYIEFDPSQFDEPGWKVYKTAFKQFANGLPPSIQLTQAEYDTNGRQAVNSAFEDAVERGWLPDDAKRPEIEVIKPAPVRTPGQERQHRRTIRRRLIALASAAALALTFGAVTGGIEKYGETYHAVTTDRPVPSSAELAVLRVKTEAACNAYERISKYKHPPEVSEFGNNRYELGQNVDKLIVTGDNVSFTVPKGIQANELYFCSYRGNLNVLGKVATLGINSRYSDTQILGDVSQAYLVNDRDESYYSDSDDNTADVHGHVGDFLVQGNDLDASGGPDKRGEDVLVWGRVDNAIETDKGHGFLWEFDTRGQGTIGRYQVA